MAVIYIYMYIYIYICKKLTPLRLPDRGPSRLRISDPPPSPPPYKLCITFVSRIYEDSESSDYKVDCFPECDAVYFGWHNI